jgi:hypothetical protein
MGSTNSGQNFDSEQLPVELQALATEIRTLAKHRQGDTLAILELLRLLETLHREVQDNVFQPSLPDNRQALYALLRDIEADGGWPYIPRMKLQSLLRNFASESAGKPISETLTSQHSSSFDRGHGKGDKGDSSD